MAKVNFGMRFMNSHWFLPKYLTHLIVYGQIGTGKSQTLKSCAERAYIRNVKIIDLYSGGAEEGAYWALKSNHPFWKDREFHSKGRVLKARDFPVKCLIPMSKNLPGELPDIFVPFTIPLTSLTENDLKANLGNNLTKNEIALWRKVSPKINRKTTLIDLTNYIIDAQKSSERTPGIHGTGISSLWNTFRNFESSMLFSSESNPLALNLKNELRNRKTITTLELNYYPQELWGFIINYFIYNIYEIIRNKENHINHPVIILIREAGDWLTSIGEVSSQEQAIRTNFTHIVRKGRKHRLYFWLDNQTPMNLDVVQSQFPVKICHYVDNTVELENSLGSLGAMLLTREDYMNLRSFAPGRCYVLEQRGLFAPQMLPPQSRMSGKEGANFVEIWRKEKGNARFKNIKSLISPVYEEYEQSKEKWDEIIKNRKEKIKILKELAKKRKKEELENERDEREKERALKKKLNKRKNEDSFPEIEYDEAPLEQGEEISFI